MPFCSAYGCNSRSERGSGVHFFHFPAAKSVRQKWTHYCKREHFTATSNNYLCSKHFSFDAYERHHLQLASWGYPDPRPRLKHGAYPDIPLDLGTTESAPKKKRTAVVKRRNFETFNTFELAKVSKTADTETVTEAISELSNSEPRDTKPSRIPIPCQRDVKCQANLKPKMRTRSNQTTQRQHNRSTQKRPETRSIAIQCNISPHPSDETDEDSGSDSDYVPEQDFDDNPADPHITLQAPKHPSSEKYYLVASNKLRELLQYCPECQQSNRRVSVCAQVGSMVVLESCCTCGNQSIWQSQDTCNNMPWGNLLVAANILLTGCSPAQIIRLFDNLMIPFISRTTYDKLQSCYAVPAISQMWSDYQASILRQIGNDPLVIGGDGRCDSPGYSAKYGSYTMMDLDSRLILDVQLVQSNEVNSSNQMELEGMKRSIRHLEDSGCNINSIVTDRHVSIKKYMREEKAHINHYFDVWHVAKGVQKKLEAASKKKGCSNLRPWIKSISNHMYWVASGGNPDNMLQQWLSISNHVANIHIHSTPAFPKCEHGDMECERQWIKKDSRAHQLLVDVIESSYLVKDIPKLSPLHQTYSLEVFHSVLNHFAPKSHHYFFPAMKTRLLIATFHFNENSNKEQSETADGEKRWSICFPRAKKGECAVVKPVNNEPTFDYVKVLLAAIIEQRMEKPSYKEALPSYQKLRDEAPKPLTSKYQKPNKDMLVSEISSRYQKS